MKFEINLYILFFMLSLLLMFGVYIFVPEVQSISLQVSVLLVSTCSIFLYLRSLKIINKSISWISFNIIFLFGFIIVYFQIPILNVLGFRLPPLYFSYIWGNETVINKSVLLSSIGLLSFFIGALIFRKQLKVPHFNMNVKNHSIFLLLLFTYLFYFLFLVNAGSYIYGEYTPDDATGWASYFYKLFKVFLSACIIVKVSEITMVEKDNLPLNQFLNIFGYPLAFILGVFLLLSLFVGDRGPVIYFSLLSFGVYFLRFKKINFFKMITAVITLSIILTVIGEVRQSRSDGSSFSSRVVATITNVSSDKRTSRMYDEIVPGDKTLELAMSIRTLNHSILNVPDKHEHTYGLFQIKYLYSIIPGLSGKLNNLLFDGDKKYDSSSTYITYLIQGDKPLYGDGTSILADIYLDFGVYGIIFIMFLLGAFITRNEWRLNQGQQYTNLAFIMMLLFFANSLYINRSAILLQVSNVFLVYLVIKINQTFSERFSKSKINKYGAI